MELFYLLLVAFLFLLAAFDLFVGVSNDAVNFLNSAIGSRAARFRTVVCVAAVGVFAGACLSNGMMDIARHGIFNPSEFHFGEVMCIFLAVMVTDIVLLDVFNSFGMPTSTTVSMVFELLGAAFALSMVKMAADATGMGFGDYLNTAKALEVILGIFLSVPIAFVVGSLVQYFTRLLFTFDWHSNAGWKIGVFGGLALTAILYFMLFKGLKDLSFMNAGVKAFIHDHLSWLLGGCFVVSTGLMMTLHWLKVNVFRVVVLTGTFSLATAFAGNDLVNFIGVPLAGLASYQDFVATGSGNAMDFLMTSLQGSAQTPVYFLVGAGAIMVFSLATSKKARNVVKTEVGLSSSDQGEELFGSSRAARSLVRWGNAVGQWVERYTPASVQHYIDRRFAPVAAEKADGAAYDLVRASVNLCVASLLIALGTTLKLPLSTTFVTFMVAMGTSLSDRAWTRESAVFRITGVLTVIGGWFITAGVAFTACFFVALLMYYGGIVAIVLIVAVALTALVHSQIRYSRKQNEERQGDVLFQQMMSTTDAAEIVPMLDRHIRVSTAEQLEGFAAGYSGLTEGLLTEHLRELRRSERDLIQNKRTLKNLRRRETLCLRRAGVADASLALRFVTTFHLVHNALRQIEYGLLRIAEPVREHVDNHFSPVAPEPAARFAALGKRLHALLADTAAALRQGSAERYEELRAQLAALKEDFAALRHAITRDLSCAEVNLTTATLLLHTVQESEQIAGELRTLLREFRRYQSLV